MAEKIKRMRNTPLLVFFVLCLILIGAFFAPVFPRLTPVSREDLYFFYQAQGTRDSASVDEWMMILQDGTWMAQIQSRDQEQQEGKYPLEDLKKLREAIDEAPVIRRSLWRLTQRYFRSKRDEFNRAVFRRDGDHMIEVRLKRDLTDQIRVLQIGLFEEDL